MQKIDLYFGNRKRKEPSEDIVLARVIRWLEENDTPAVIICDVWLNNDQIDILVGTATTTLQLEVKGYRWPVTGEQNGDWEVTYDDGRVARRKNGYLQALRNNQTLRDEMSRHLGSGENVPYPNGAVIFEPCIPDGSVLNIRVDKRVAVCGSGELGRLLSTPSPRAWPLPWLHDFARARKYIPHALPYTGASADQRAGNVKNVASTPIAPVARAIRPSSGSAVSDVVFAPATALTTREPATVVVESIPAGRPHDVPQAIRQRVPFGSGRVALTPPKQRRGWLRYAPVLFATLIAAYIVKHHHALQPSATQQKSTVQPGAPKAGMAARQPNDTRHATARRPLEKRPKSGESVNRVAIPVQAQAAASSERPPAAITCPAGVDRLGCNGRTGVLSNPECPPAFHVSDNTCIRDIDR
ncbi:nuclease-related domain-containing protein [Burkholderia stagnalis]|uniref:nuclease-related domain-containing protein n=1 Tax=Burkholderia stagnalis TaxID=1503054 RepID=UPI0009C07CC9|nr:nuclease-related domain-containing protein [Burkholderia stagnalis]